MKAYRLCDGECGITRRVCATRSILPEGLPRAYVLVTTLRLRSPAHKMKVDLLRVVSQDGLPQMAVTLNGVEKAVIFTTTATGISKKGQSVVFNSKGIQVHLSNKQQGRFQK